MLKEHGNFHFSEKAEINKINISKEKNMNVLPLEINSSNFQIGQGNNNSGPRIGTDLIQKKLYENNSEKGNINSTSNILNSILNTQNLQSIENPKTGLPRASRSPRLSPPWSPAGKSARCGP